MTTTAPARANAAATAVTVRTWSEGSGSPARGTVVLLVGRGETAEVYERLGRRLAADAWRVVALGDDVPAPQTVVDVLADPALPAPVVLLGVDAGALTAVRVARHRPDLVAAVVLAGMPTPGGLWGLPWHAELDARTACPAHRRVLEQAVRHSLFADATTVHAADLADEGGPLPVPLVALHGADDRLSPASAAVPRYRALGARHVGLVAGGRHDVLNDVAHRSVTAELVQLLERVRLGADLPAVVVDVTADGGDHVAPDRAARSRARRRA